MFLLQKPLVIGWHVMRIVHEPFLAYMDGVLCTGCSASREPFHRVVISNLAHSLESFAGVNVILAVGLAQHKSAVGCG